jgi:hypothetical protein
VVLFVQVTWPLTSEDVQPGAAQACPPGGSWNAVATASQSDVVYPSNP